MPKSMQTRYIGMSMKAKVNVWQSRGASNFALGITRSSLGSRLAPARDRGSLQPGIEALSSQGPRLSPARDRRLVIRKWTAANSILLCVCRKSIMQKVVKWVMPVVQWGCTPALTPTSSKRLHCKRAIIHRLRTNTYLRYAAQKSWAWLHLNMSRDHLNKLRQTYHVVSSTSVGV